MTAMATSRTRTGRMVTTFFGLLVSPRCCARGSAAAVPRRTAPLCRRSQLHDHGLGLGEELSAVGAALTADARVLVAPERGPQVAHEEAVDPDGAGPDGGRDLVGAAQALGEDHRV